MSPTIRHKYKYFHSTVQRAKDRRQKFHFCRLPFDVRPRNVKHNLSIVSVHTRADDLDFFTLNFAFRYHFFLVGCLIPSNCVPPLARALLTTDAQQEPIVIM